MHCYAGGPNGNKHACAQPVLCNPNHERFVELDGYPMHFCCGTVHLCTSASKILRVLAFCTVGSHSKHTTLYLETISHTRVAEEFLNNLSPKPLGTKSVAACSISWGFQPSVAWMFAFRDLQIPYRAWAAESMPKHQADNCTHTQEPGCCPNVGPRSSS